VAGRLALAGIGVAGRAGSVAAKVTFGDPGGYLPYARQFLRFGRARVSAGRAQALDALGADAASGPFVAGQTVLGTGGFSLKDLAPGWGSYRAWQTVKAACEL
jgi:hypothetical protein